MGARRARAPRGAGPARGPRAQQAAPRGREAQRAPGPRRHAGHEGRIPRDRPCAKARAADVWMGEMRTQQHRKKSWCFPHLQDVFIVHRLRVEAPGGEQGMGEEGRGKGVERARARARVCARECA
jgi:hypothetical protein